MKIEIERHINLLSSAYGYQRERVFANGNPTMHTLIADDNAVVTRMPDSTLPHRMFHGQVKQGHRSVGGHRKVQHSI